MATVQVKSEIDIEFDQLLDGVAQLNTPDLEYLLSEVSLLLARRKAPSLPKRESELLTKINQGLPDPIQQRYNELTAKLRAKKITTIEHQELLKLIDQVELADAARLENLIELAQLRDIPLQDLIKQLGIHPPLVVYV